MILFPEVTISALSLIFNINDGILRILIDHASKLGKYQDQRRRTERDSQWKYQGKYQWKYQGKYQAISGEYRGISWEISGNMRGNISIQIGKISAKERNSQWSRLLQRCPVSRRSGLRALQKRIWTERHNFLNLITSFIS